MKIVKDYPPNYDAICRAIPAVRQNPRIIFTYGDKLYAPSFKGLDDQTIYKGELIPDHLMAHEETHTRQQGDDIEGWWDRYLTDVQFRLDQEVEAYHVQWKMLVERYDRPHRRRMLKAICHDLAGTWYGRLVTKEQARRLIQRGVE